MDRLINLKNVSCVIIRQDPKEWGRHWNGGDYGSKEIYSRSTPGQPFQVEYHSTAEQDFDYCPLRGAFQRCEDCSDWDREENFCHGEPEEVTVAELSQILESIDLEREYISEIEEFGNA